MIHLFYIVGAVQALFFSLLLAFKKKKSRADHFLMAFFMIIMISLLFAFCASFELYKDFPLIMPIIALVPLLYGPVLYFYVKALTASSNEKPRYLLHGLPVGLYYLFVSPAFFNRTDLIKTFTHRFIDLPAYMNVAVGILYLSAPVYFVFILLRLKKHRDQLKGQETASFEVNLNWLNYLVMGAMFLWLMEIVRIVYVNYVGHTLAVHFNQGIKTAYVIFIFMLGFYGLRQGHIFVEGPVESHASLKYKRKKGKDSNLNGCPESLDTDEAPLIARLLAIIEEEKVYLNPNLRLMDVAFKLDVPPHVLSCAINKNLNQNFFGLINTYRVEEAQSMLIANRFSNKTILAIAYDCGFNSKASFNRIFKEHTGFTPSMFIKMITIG